MKDKQLTLAIAIVLAASPLAFAQSTPPDAHPNNARAHKGFGVAVGLASVSPSPASPASGVRPAAPASTGGSMVQPSLRVATPAGLAAPASLSMTAKRDIIRRISPSTPLPGVMETIRLTPSLLTVPGKANLLLDYPAQICGPSLRGAGREGVLFDAKSVISKQIDGRNVGLSSGVLVNVATAPGRSYLVTLGIDWGGSGIDSPASVQFSTSLSLYSAASSTLTWDTQNFEFDNSAGQGSGRVLSVLIPATPGGGERQVSLATPSEGVFWGFYWVEIDPL